MTPRIETPYRHVPEGIKALYALEASFRHSGIDPILAELIKLRASQINACAFCLHMHATDAKKLGETEMRILMLNAWRESTLYTDKERAVLGWTEALTRLAASHPSEEAYAEFARHVPEAEQVQITLMIGAINLWNRLQVGFGATHPPV